MSLNLIKSGMTGKNKNRRRLLMVFKLFCGISNFYKCKCEKIQIISLFMWRHTQKMCLQAVESFWPVLMGFRDPLVKAQIVESL
jgi:hypothetical protein